MASEDRFQDGSTGAPFEVPADLRKTVASGLDELRTQVADSAQLLERELRRAANLIDPERAFDRSTNRSGWPPASGAEFAILAQRFVGGVAGGLADAFVTSEAAGTEPAEDDRPVADSAEEPKKKKKAKTQKNKKNTKNKKNKKNKKKKKKTKA